MPRVRYDPCAYEKSLYKRVKCKSVKCKSVKLPSLLSPARELKPWKTPRVPPLPASRNSNRARLQEPPPCPSSPSSTLSRIMLGLTQFTTTT
nr:MAG TPA: hypothetical protein [Caudoviricetes sp.]